MQYPKQLDASVRDNLNLSVNQEFTLKEKDEEAPLEMFSPYSRYVFNIGDKAKRTGVKANLSMKDYPRFKLKLDTLLNEIIKKSFFNAAASNTTESKAYTLQIMKQGTAAELILKTKSTDYILKLRDNLQSNLAKYAMNANQIEAIDEAIELFKSGLLEECKKTEKEGERILVWEQEDKYFRETENIGGEIYNHCYGFKLVYITGYALPFEFEITNYWAPLGPSRTNPKLTVIQKSKTVKRLSYSYKISEGEMIHFIDQMDECKKNFISMCFHRQYMISYNESYKNRTQPKEEQGEAV